MAGEFISIPWTTDATTMADDAVEVLEGTWVGWIPGDSDLEVIQIEALAPMAQDVVRQASIMPGAALRQFGYSFFGISKGLGNGATAYATFTFGDTAGHTIPIGFQVNIDGWAFETTTTTVISAGNASATGVELRAVVAGAAGNSLNAASARPMSSLDTLTTVVITSGPSGGVDPQDDDAYTDEVVRQFQLTGLTLVSPRDFELRSLQEAYVGRVVAFNPGTGRNVTVVAVHPDGTALSTGEKALLTTILSDVEYRHVNVVVTVTDPTYTAVAVSVTVKAYPGSDFPTVKAAVEQKLASIFDPRSWGQPFSTEGQRDNIWYNDVTIRRNKIIDLVSDVEGVDYVTALTINGNSTTDVTMTGTVALPTPGTMIATVS